MKTYIDCIPCFYRQAIESSRIAGLSEVKIKKVIDKIGGTIADIGLGMTPPEMGAIFQKIIQDVSGNRDLYKDAKDKSNRLAFDLYDKVKKKVRASKDKLLTAIESAIAGNIIDFGVKNSLNVEKELEKIMSEENKMIKNENKIFFAYDDFKNKIERSKKIIYLADNCGETVFDRVLIEEIQNLYPSVEVIYSVKEKPILNDALLEDAVFCGIDKICKTVSTGSVIPGTVLKLCSAEFLEIYKDADMVISKGQGNFESFVDDNKPVFYLFMAKCPVVAKEVGSETGNINLFYNKGVNL